jgi:phenylalanine-4-hydroxylase
MTTIPQSSASIGLTQGKAPIIEDAYRKGQYSIEQAYALYSDENHAAWGHLYAAMEGHWRRYANDTFLKGIEVLRLDRGRVPRFEDVNEFLYPLTRFKVTGVSGFLPSYVFFDCLRKREFPTTVTVRAMGQEFAEWPDIFHDITGHVPMHTDPAFAETLVRFGECANTAVEIAAANTDKAARLQQLSSIIKAITRFFWFTIEVGLIRNKGEIKAYGSALMSSRSEIVRSIESPDVQRYPLQLEWVINQCFLPNYFQPILFYIDSFDHLYELVDRFEGWMRKGMLSNVAPGEPNISEMDLDIFLRQAV